MTTRRQTYGTNILSVLLIGSLIATTSAHAAEADDKEEGSSIQKTIGDIFDGAGPGSLTMDGITVYGIVDLDMSYQSHGAPQSPYMNGQDLVAKNSAGSRFDVANNAMSQSAIGLRADQPLDTLFGIRDLKGWAFTGNVATGFDPAFGRISDNCKSLVRANGKGDAPGTTANTDSARCGQAFNGEAWAGVRNESLGQLSFGRENSLMFDDMIIYDPQKISYANSLLGTAGTYGGGFGDTEDKIWNDALKYAVKIGPGRFSAQYRFSGGDQGGEAYAVNAGFDGWGAIRGLSIDAVWGQFKDAIAVSSLTNSSSKANGSCQSFGVTLAQCTDLDILNATVSDNTAWSVMAKYNLASIDVPTVDVMGGYEAIDYSNPKDTLAAGSKTIGGYALNFTGTSFNTYTTDKLVNLFWAGARWAITPKLTAAGAWYYFNQNSYIRAGAACTSPDAGTASQSQCRGDLNWYSATLDYQLTKRVDVYTGISYDRIAGGLSSGYTQSSTMNVTTGARFRF